MQQLYFSRPKIPNAIGLSTISRVDKADAIFATPLNVEVMPRRAGQTFTDLSSPRGLTITRDGHLIIAECGKNCISFIDPTNGRKTNSIRNFWSREVQLLHYSLGVAVTHNGDIVIAEHYNDPAYENRYYYRLQFLSDRDGFAISGDPKWHQPLLPHHCDGIAVHPNGNIFVSMYHSVKVYNAGYCYSHQVGSKGASSEPGEFNYPHGIAFDADGMVYVADCGNNRIQKFTPEGKLLAVINSKGEGGRLNSPCGLCVDGNGILYVTEYNSSTVSMFSSNGRFLGYIGDSDGSSFEHPWDIVSDQTGRLYISTKNGVVTY